MSVFRTPFLVGHISVLAACVTMFVVGLLYLPGYVCLLAILFALVTLVSLGITGLLFEIEAHLRTIKENELRVSRRPAAQRERKVVA